MSNRQLLPQGLGEMPPGPQLAAVLVGIDQPRVSGFDLVEVLRARYRQVNHERAELLNTMVEIGLCGIGPDDELPRRSGPDEFGADEVRAALVWTRTAAEGQYWRAVDLVRGLPAVFAALRAGELDEPRARVFSEWTHGLTPEQRRAVCDELLPRAAALTTGQLIEQLKKAAIAIDPDWARRRYEEAVAERRVVGYRNPDGSAALSGQNLPVDRVITAAGRLEALAKAAKHAGHPDPLDHLRADLFLGMTDGGYAGLDDAAILAALLGTTAGADSDPAEPDPGPDSTDRGDQDEPDNGDDGQGGDPDDGPDGDGDGGTRSAGGPASARPGVGMELRVRLSTLLGHDQAPAELAGWGFVHTELARDLAAGLIGAQWRFAVTDEHGRLAHCGITRARPTGSPRHYRGPGIVELHIPAATLEAVAADPTRTGAWAPVVADLAAQHAAAQQAADSGADPYAADADRRFAGAALRRHAQVRDRYCRFPGCRARAVTADLDHTRDHGHGGPTADHNLGPLCGHEHTLKHEAGWRLDQPQAGHFVWTSPRGRQYHVAPPRILDPLPDPQPRTPPGEFDDPTEPGDHDTPIWRAPASPLQPEPRPPPPDNDEEPPF